MSVTAFVTDWVFPASIIPESYICIYREWNELSRFSSVGLFVRVTCFPQFEFTELRMPPNITKQLKFWCESVREPNVHTYISCLHLMYRRYWLQQYLWMWATFNLQMSHKSGEKKHNELVLTTFAVVHNSFSFMNLLSSPLSPPSISSSLLPSSSSPSPPSQHHCLAFHFFSYPSLLLKRIQIQPDVFHMKSFSSFLHTQLLYGHLEQTFYQTRTQFYKFVSHHTQQNIFYIKKEVSLLVFIQYITTVEAHKWERTR